MTVARHSQLIWAWLLRSRERPGFVYAFAAVLMIAIFCLTRNAMLAELLLLLPVVLLAVLGGRLPAVFAAAVIALLTAPFFPQTLLTPALEPIRWVLLSLCYLVFAFLIGRQVERQRSRQLQQSADVEAKLAEAGEAVAHYKSLLNEMHEGQAFLERMNDELAFLNTIANAVNRTLDAAEVQATAMEYIVKLLQVDEVQIYWMSRHSDCLKLQAMHSSLQDAIDIEGVPPVHFGEGMLGDVLSYQQVNTVSESIGNLHLLPPGLHPEITSVIAVPMSLHTRLSGVLVLGRKDGKAFTSSDEQLLESAGRILAVAIEKARMFKQAQELSMADALTGLANRRMFDLQLDAEVSRSRLTKDPLCLVIFDLDFFKRVNDEYGHPAGDEVLYQFAQRVQQDIRTGDLLCRLGGEEFALITQNTGLNDSLTIAERISRHISEEPFELEDGTHLSLTVSAGVATVSDGIENVDTLFAAADQALYAAKAAGRNRVLFCCGDEGLAGLPPSRRSAPHVVPELKPEVRPEVKAEAIAMHGDRRN